MIAALLFTAATARADGSAVDQADRLFNDGRRAAETRDYARACKLFEESFRLDPAIGTLINLGDCAEHTGDLERAIAAYHTAQARMTPGDDRAPRVRERIEHIEAHAAKLTLNLEGAEGAVATLDGAIVDPKKSPLHVAAGAHVVLVTAVGYSGARFALTLADGESRALSLSPGGPLEAVLPTTSVSTGAPSWMTPTAIGALGVGVASAWIGSLAGLTAIDRRDVQRASCNAANVCTQAGFDAARDGAAWATASTIAFVVSGVLLAAGGSLLVISLAHRGKTTIAFGPFFAQGRFE